MIVTLHSPLTGAAAETLIGGAQDIVSRLRFSAWEEDAHHADNRSYMTAAAARALLWNGAIIETTGEEAFLRSLAAAGLVTLTKTETEPGADSADEEKQP